MEKIYNFINSLDIDTDDYPELSVPYSKRALTVIVVLGSWLFSLVAVLV